MGRLKGRGMTARIGRPASRLGAAKPAPPRPEGHRPAWHKWYYLARWRRLRWDVLTAAAFTCEQTGCGRIEVDTSKLVADHIVPHRGDPVLFWDRANLQCLCKACHDSRKQKQERREGWGG